MKSRVSLLLALPFLLASQAPASGPPGAPRATAGNGEAGAYDAVGFARVVDGTAMSAAHAQLPIGSIAEVTALGGGQVTLVQVTARSTRGDVEIELSRAAAQALGLTGEMDAVRVRSIQADAADAAALRNGGSAAPRLPAPDALLRGLRRMLPALPADERVATIQPPRRVASTRSVTPTRPPLAAPARPTVSDATSRIGQLVQVAALRDEPRARALARALHGRVEAGGGWWRVRLGPFATRSAAQRARDAAISRGYGDAAIIPAP